MSPEFGLQALDIIEDIRLSIARTSKAGPEEERAIRRHVDRDRAAMTRMIEERATE
jgi:hypothetical protein